uniref:Uncharacterized protein n=1 Tax=Chaetoceros debilis TaxID=122233 RepID=A0A6S8UUH2_9STRA|mmetsp:Transcript_4754/g.6965  ORF Transcript_4754/g.6965 Transcript_4754/m.6965 type:complete len:115 (+) Transcript_4754:174-518(+)
MDTSIYRQLRKQDFFIKDLDYSRRVRDFRALRDGRSAAGPKKMKIQVRQLMNMNNTQTQTQTQTKNEIEDSADIVVYLAPTERIDNCTPPPKDMWNISMKDFIKLMAQSKAEVS